MSSGRGRRALLEGRRRYQLTASSESKRDESRTARRVHGTAACRSVPWELHSDQASPEAKNGSKFVASVSVRPPEQASKREVRTARIDAVELAQQILRQQLLGRRTAIFDVSLVAQAHLKQTA